MVDDLEERNSTSSADRSASRSEEKGRCANERESSQMSMSMWIITEGTIETVVKI